MTHPIRRIPGGLFLVVEGTDGVGKGEACARVGKALIEQGYLVKLTHQPGGTEVGAEIRRIVKSAKYKREIDATAQLLLFAADRYVHINQVVRPRLADGWIVISDRYDHSTMAYQAVQGGDPEQLRIINAIATGGLRPDRCYLLDLDPRIAAERMQGASRDPDDRFDQEKLPFHESLREAYLTQWRANLSEIRRIDARPSPEIVAGAILRDINQLIARKES